MYEFGKIICKTTNTSYFQISPMNAYYGSVLCTSDVNADGYDDLLVGAPMLTYSELDSDVGAVFLYLGISIKV